MDIANSTAVLMYQSLISQIDAFGAGHLYLYGGVPPANVNVGLNQNTLLSEHVLSNPVGTVVTTTTNGVPQSHLEFAAIAPDVSANAYGIPNFFRITDGNLTPIIQGTAGNINLSAIIYTGNVVQITGLQFTLA